LSNLVDDFTHGRISARRGERGKELGKGHRRDDDDDDGDDQKLD